MSAKLTRAVTRTTLIILLGGAVLVAATSLRFVGPGNRGWRLWGRAALLWLFAAVYLPLAARALIGRRWETMSGFHRRLTTGGMIVLVAGGCLSAVGVGLHLAHFRIGLALIVAHVLTAVPGVACLAAGLYESRFWRRGEPAPRRGEDT